MQNLAALPTTHTHTRISTQQGPTKQRMQWNVNSDENGHFTSRTTVYRVSITFNFWCVWNLFLNKLWKFHNADVTETSWRHYDVIAMKWNERTQNTVADCLKSQKLAAASTARVVTSRNGCNQQISSDLLLLISFTNLFSENKRMFHRKNSADFCKKIPKWHNFSSLIKQVHYLDIQFWDVYIMKTITFTHTVNLMTFHLICFERSYWYSQLLKMLSSLCTKLLQLSYTCNQHFVPLKATTELSSINPVTCVSLNSHEKMQSCIHFTAFLSRKIL